MFEPLLFGDIAALPDTDTQAGELALHHEGVPKVHRHPPRCCGPASGPPPGMRALRLPSTRAYGPVRPSPPTPPLAAQEVFSLAEEDFPTLGMATQHGGTKRRPHSRNASSDSGRRRSRPGSALSAGSANEIGS
jgi:hypothetical protein